MVLAVGMNNPQSIEEACEILEMYKRLREEPFGKSGSGTVRMKTVKSARGEVKFVTEERFDELKSTMEKKLDEMSSIPRRGLSENRRHEGGNRTFKRRNMATVECYRCHEFGHYATDCPTRQPAVEEVVVHRAEN